MSTGVTPAVLLIDPKYAQNVGVAQRAASCYGIEQVWWTGHRVPISGDGKRFRLPREERMKDYGSVTLFNTDYPFDEFDSDVVPVAVEVRPNSESLPDFIHPEKALYVFGPEDGGLTRVTLRHCQRFVTIPTAHCLNLAVAIGTVLYDRACKRGERFDVGITEQRGYMTSDPEELKRVVA
jgi:tRNA C32,U32 (ribose-2'-O)-methylase TrmJ